MEYIASVFNHQMDLRYRYFCYQGAYESPE